MSSMDSFPQSEIDELDLRKFIALLKTRKNGLETAMLVPHSSGTYSSRPIKINFIDGKIRLQEIEGKRHRLELIPENIDTVPKYYIYISCM